MADCRAEGIELQFRSALVEDERLGPRDECAQLRAPRHEERRSWMPRVRTVGPPRALPLQDFYRLLGQETRTGFWGRQGGLQLDDLAGTRGRHCVEKSRRGCLLLLLSRVDQFRAS